jgi:L-lactate utilization protein LutB
MRDFSNVTKALKERGFKVSVFETGEQAAAYISGQIADTTVGFGGSKTLEAIGLYDKLSENNDVIWHWKATTVAYENLSKDDTENMALIKQARDKAAKTEVYICSANAIAETGEIVNIDGAGNRVSSMLWGHKRIFYVIGSNKLMPTYEQAVWRARNVAAPKRAQSMHKKTPCAVKADKCYDCSSPQRICHGMVTLWKPMLQQECEVVLIDEELGY